MDNNSQSKKRILEIVFLTIIVVIISGGAFIWERSLVAKLDFNDTSNSVKYSKALQDVNKFMSNYSFDFFEENSFRSLKSFATLPIQVGLIGNSDPITPPPTPEQLLEPQTQQ